MAIARTGVYVDDYLEYASTLPAELQRLLNTIRELDERSQSMINQTRQQTKYCLGLASQSLKKGNYNSNTNNNYYYNSNYNNQDDEVAIEKIWKDVESNQDSALSLCTEKVLLARQAYDLIDSHVKRLDEDLNNFAEDLKQEGKLAPDERVILPPLPIAPKSEKRKPFYGTPQAKRLDYRDRDWDRERDRDFELMPPPGSHRKEFAAPVDVDQPIDPNEPTYCVCHQVSFGDMIACDNENCQGGEWFHYSCVGLTPETRFKGKWSAMGRNLSPILRQELANLDKDADSRKSAMKALKSYVKDLDSKTIPLFLAQVSENKGTGSLSGECTISLYEVLARVHGVKIVPLIDSIMTCIISTLASSAGSFPLQQACSKVVPAIARYGIDPTTTEDKKRHIIHSLCKPLSDALLGSQECLTSGAALCLKALVDSDNWRFASDEMVNKVCQNVAGALEEKSTQTNSHMGLVMVLAKRNGLIVEAYARLLTQSGLQILSSGVAEGNSQKRLLAIQMVNFLMKSLDPRSIFSELELIIEEMEKCQSDRMAYVRGAAFEALQTARKISAMKGLNFENGPGSITGSSFSRREHRRNLCNAGDISPSSASPESQTLDSFIGYDSLGETPISMRQVPRNSDYDRRSVNRKLWSYENGGVDVSLKDGLFSEIVQGSPMSNTHSLNDEYAYNGEFHAEEFSGFLPRNPRSGISRSTTSSPQRSRTRIDVDNIKIFKTPRKLICSLQDPNDGNSDFFQKQGRRFRSLSSSNIQWSPSAKYDQNCFSHELNYNGKENGGPESVSSTDDVLTDADLRVSQEAVPDNETAIQRAGVPKARQKTALKFVCGLVFASLALFTPLLWINVQDEGYYLVPT